MTFGDLYGLAHIAFNNTRTMGVFLCHEPVSVSLPLLCRRHHHRLFDVAAQVDNGISFRYNVTGCFTLRSARSVLSRRLRPVPRGEQPHTKRHLMCPVVGGGVGSAAATRRSVLWGQPVPGALQSRRGVCRFRCRVRPDRPSSGSRCRPSGRLACGRGRRGARSFCDPPPGG